MSSKKGPGARKKDAIHFVNARPSSESEKLKIQRLVRAHVGKWISDQTKDRSTPEEGVPQQLSADPADPNAFPITEEDEESPSSSSSKSSRTSPIDSSSSSSNSSAPFTQPWHQGKSLAPAQSGVGDYIDETYHHETYNHDNRIPDSRTLSPRSQSLHLERIGTSFIDPFQTYPSSISPHAVQSCETYLLHTLWPILTPSPPGQSGPPANTSWFPLSLSDSTLFTAFVFGALSHQRVQWMNRWIPDAAFGAREQQLLELAEFQTIKLINTAVADPTRALSDAIILSVICMAHNRAEEHDRGKYRTPPFTAPLRRLQWLDVYGSQTPNLVHIRGLVQIVGLRGGLQNVELPGLAPIVSFSDIFTAATFLTPPVFSFIPLHRDRRGLTMQDLVGFGPVDIQRGFGQLQSIGLTPQMAEVFQGLRTYINVTEDYVTGKLKNYDVSLLCDQRNITMYALLSLPPATQPSHAHDIIYEACRLAALIYGVGVAFPLPGQSTPLTRLAELVRTTLQSSHSPSIWASSKARIALLWILTLGGIAAETTPEREWFVNALGQAARQTRVSSWIDLRKILGLMLWYCRACDQPGQKLWLEVERTFDLMAGSP